MSFYLVQRLTKAHENNGKKGFDRHFTLDYMGSAEYEFGTPNASLKRMRAKPLVVFHHELQACRGQLLDEAQHIFFIGHKDGLLDKITAFEEWLAAPRQRGKEVTYFPENLMGEADDYKARTIAWWSYDDDLAWTLSPGYASLLVTAFLPTHE